MTEMSHSVQEVAQNAQSSQHMVEQVEVASESGRQIMSTNISTINQLETRLLQSVDAVKDLQSMSSKIGSILDVIRNIAEQTNLLALNAAIEAARAVNKEEDLQWLPMKYGYWRKEPRRLLAKSKI